MSVAIEVVLRAVEVLKPAHPSKKAGFPQVFDRFGHAYAPGRGSEMDKTVKKAIVLDQNGATQYRMERFAHHKAPWSLPSAHNAMATDPLSLCQQFAQTRATSARGQSTVAETQAKRVALQRPSRTPLRLGEQTA
ncbi:hypothetical protein ACFFTM_10775 [Pseudoduganella plicata]|uniref:Transposase n=1 Tax=Pseudoduganella plicata TaxID=321984 RepID=A0A4P7BD09_9BURK|nr:hypothetical protein [Pseudoduganella plicata]QBQ36070.1 hypothetical protein E1742_07825 [Pseudoduganella plicata]GGY78331.1 hypothetical protein GCM10007388_09000 [Pseudoduganella plicata]